MKRSATSMSHSPETEAPEPPRAREAKALGEACSTESLALAFEHSPVGLAIVHASGIVLHANPAFASMLGYSADELDGKTIAVLNHSEDLAASRMNLERMSRGEIDAYEMTKRCVHKGGGIVWVRLHASWLRDRNDGRVLFHLTDVSAEKASRDNLSLSEQRFSQMAEAINQAFWSYSVDPFRLLYSSPAAERILGFDPTDTADTAGAHIKRMLAAVHPDDLPVFAEMMSDVLTAAREREYRIVRPSGEIRWLRARVFPFHDTAGVAHGIAGVTEDITERKESDLQLQKYHAIKHLITQFSSEFVNLSAEKIDESFVAALGALSQVSGACRAAIWLLDEAGATMKLKWYWYPPDREPPRLDTIRKLQVARAPIGSLPQPTAHTLDDLPAQLTCARSTFADDGLRAFLQVPLTSGGRLLGIVGFASSEEKTWSQDMSSLLGIAAGMFANAIDRLRAERETRVHRDQLAHVLRLRTMGQLTSGIAHELNQPLSAILSYARGCVRRIESGDTKVEEIQGALERIGEQAIRAADVIRALRALVKPGTTPKPHDINSLVHEALKLVQGDLLSSRVRLVLDLKKLPNVEVDAIQIEQVVLNLIRNAYDAIVDAAPEQKQIHIASASHDAKSIEVSIRDLGPGISIGQEEQIFDDFHTSKPDGLGLGLPISRSIVEAHGGHLWLDASVVPGACFRFTLPLSR